MIIIAESGSSKTDWYLIPENTTEKTKLETIGFNPYFISQQQFSDTLRQEVLPHIKEAPQALYFYAAGISSENKQRELTTMLTAIFPNAQVDVQSDMMAAVRAVCPQKEGIVCILGTGSNSCKVSEGKVIEQIPALGYVLGDEGSGAYLGIQFLSRYFYNELPLQVKQDFQKQLAYTDDEIFEAVYRRPLPNRFLASLVPFIHQYKHEQVLKTMLLQAFQLFVDKHILPYQATDVPVSFVGSVAYYFKSELLQVCRKNDIMIGCIIQKPIDELVKWHLAQNH